jgi:hypothetical protein
MLDNDTFENPGRTITAVNGTAITAGGAAVAVTNGSVEPEQRWAADLHPALNFNSAQCPCSPTPSHPAASARQRQST